VNLTIPQIPAPARFRGKHPAPAARRRENPPGRTLELTTSQARYLREYLAARESLIQEVIRDSEDYAERLELAAQSALGDDLARSLFILLRTEVNS
jgi:hypothetical protein